MTVLLRTCNGLHQFPAEHLVEVHGYDLLCSLVEIQTLAGFDGRVERHQQLQSAGRIGASGQ